MHSYLVVFVLAADVRIGAAQPVVLLLCAIHVAVKVVEELVPQQRVVNKIPLAPRMEVALTEKN